MGNTVFAKKYMAGTMFWIPAIYFYLSNFVQIDFLLLRRLAAAHAPPASTIIITQNKRFVWSPVAGLSGSGLPASAFISPSLKADVYKRQTVDCMAEVRGILIPTMLYNAIVK